MKGEGDNQIQASLTIFSVSLDIFQEKVKRDDQKPHFLMNFCLLEIRPEKSSSNWSKDISGRRARAVQQKFKVKLFFSCGGFPKATLNVVFLCLLRCIRPPKSHSGTNSFVKTSVCTNQLKKSGNK